MDRPKIHDFVLSVHRNGVSNDDAALYTPCIPGAHLFAEYNKCLGLPEQTHANAVPAIDGK